MNTELVKWEIKPTGIYTSRIKVVEVNSTELKDAMMVALILSSVQLQMGSCMTPL